MYPFFHFGRSLNGLNPLSRKQSGQWAFVLKLSIIVKSVYLIEWFYYYYSQYTDKYLKEDCWF